MTWTDSFPLICWVLILHQPALLQSSSHADNTFAYTSKKDNPKYCEDLCRDVNINLKKNSPILSMLVQNALPLKFKVYRRRSNHDQANYSSVRDVTDFLCDCGVKTDTSPKHWTDSLTRIWPKFQRAFGRDAKKAARSDPGKNCSPLATCHAVSWPTKSRH